LFAKYFYSKIGDKITYSDNRRIITNRIHTAVLSFSSVFFNSTNQKIVHNQATAAISARRGLEKYKNIKGRRKRKIPPKIRP